MAEELNERGEALLRLLVERYIDDGQPVGSRTLAKAMDLSLSPATIRNVMSDLEELGYLHSPHTSAGRVPTARGFRFFVNTLLNVGQPGIGEVKQLEHSVSESDDPKSLVESISNALSDLTEMAGIVTVPRKEMTSIRHVEFLPLGDKRVLAVLVFSDQEIQNSVLETDREYERAELERASNYISAALVGH
ncbi:MAG: heat-inducible transcriptional repressor HrcA, partial [Gammaproteobacteria bacterium]